MEMTLSRFRHRAEATENFLGDWIRARSVNVRAGEDETAIAECIDASRFMNDTVSSVLKNFLAGAEGCADYDQRRNVVELAERGLLACARAIENELARAPINRTMDGHVEAVDALNRLRVSIGKLKSTCPDPDSDRIARTGVEASRGEFISENEALSDAVAGA